jgi:predicted PurR-regulated permease PerM
MPARSRGSSPVAATRAERSVALPRGLLILLGLAAATVTLAGVRGIASILAPAFLALELAIAVHPIRGWLTRRRVPSWLATILVVVAAYAIVLSLTLSIMLAGARLAALLPEYQDQAQDLLDDVAAWLGSMGVEQEQVQALLDSLDVGQLAAFLTELLGGLLSVLSNIAFLLALLWFVVLDAAWFPGHLDRARDGHRELVVGLEKFAHGTRSYLVIATVFGLIVAVIDTVALWAMGVPGALIWGLLAFMTNYIPNIGFVLGLVPPAVLALLEGGPGLFLAVVVAYCLINLVIQSLIQPKVVGDKVGLSTSVTFLSLVFWTWVLGPLGALLAVPMTLLVKAVMVDVDPNSSWATPLISGPVKAVPAAQSSAADEAAPPPAAQTQAQGIQPGDERSL